METRLVWVTMLALADQHGHVDGTVRSLSRVSRVTIEQCQSALDCLLGPDTDDRSGVLDGRRLVSQQGGWGIVNHATYRNKMSADDRRERDRIRKRDARMSAPRPQVSENVRDFQQAEAEADTKAKASAKAKKATARPLTARRNLNAEFEHPRFDVPTSWHLRHVKDISEGEAGMMAFYSWLSERVDRTNEDTIVAGVEHGRFVWLDRCFAEWMLSTRKAPARLDTFAESQKRRQEELDANYDPRFEGLTMREKVELAKRLQAEEAGQS